MSVVFNIGLLYAVSRLLPVHHFSYFLLLPPASGEAPDMTVGSGFDALRSMPRPFQEVLEQRFPEEKQAPPPEERPEAAEKDFRPGASFLDPPRPQAQEQISAEHTPDSLAKALFPFVPETLDAAPDLFEPEMLDPEAATEPRPAAVPPTPPPVEDRIDAMTPAVSASAEYGGALDLPLVSHRADEGAERVMEMERVAFNVQTAADRRASISGRTRPDNSPPSPLVPELRERKEAIPDARAPGGVSGGRSGGVRETNEMRFSDFQIVAADPRLARERRHDAAASAAGTGQAAPVRQEIVGMERAEGRIVPEKRRPRKTTVPSPGNAIPEAAGPRAMPVDFPTFTSITIAAGSESLRRGITRPASPVRDFAIEYPGLSRRQGEYGAVRLAAKINERGICESVRLVESSGYPSLDAAASLAVSRARYLPALIGGAPVTTEEEFTVDFHLK